MRIVLLLSLIAPLGGCAEIGLLLARSGALTASPSQRNDNQNQGVSVTILLKDQAGKAVTSANVFAFVEGKERPAREVKAGTYLIENLPTGFSLNFEAYKDTLVAGASFTPLRDGENTFDMHFN